MYALEALFLLATSAWLLVSNTRRATRRASFVLFSLGLIAAGLAFALGQARIHMLPAAVAFLVLALLLLRRGYSHVAVRAAGVALGSIVIAVSALLAVALPVVTLPAPDGPYAVGVASAALVDDSRDEAAFGVPGRARELYVQISYPGELPKDGRAPEPRGLWQELYRAPVLDLLFGYLGGMKTHSHPGLALSPAAATYPAIVFSPSIGGIAEQNTLLMEHLASRGYIVFGITHPHFGAHMTYADGSGVASHAKVLEATSQQGAVSLDEIGARAALAASPIERARIRLEYFERGTLLNELMDVWVQDLELVLDALTRTGHDSALPGVLAGRVDTSRIGLLGMSYGGGAVTAICKEDARCRAAVNLDGGLWGDSLLEPLAVPYLVVASPPNADFFEHDLLTSEAPYYAVTVAGAAHTNFMDVSLFAPVLRWLGATGPIDGRRMIELVNVTSRRFFDAYLGAPAAPELAFDGFPELSTRTNLPQSLSARPFEERALERPQSPSYKP